MNIAKGILSLASWIVNIAPLGSVRNYAGLAFQNAEFINFTIVYSPGAESRTGQTWKLKLSVGQLMLSLLYFFSSWLLKFRQIDKYDSGSSKHVRDDGLQDFKLKTNCGGRKATRTEKNNGVAKGTGDWKEGWGKGTSKNTRSERDSLPEKQSWNAWAGGRGRSQSRGACAMRGPGA